ncbi:MAG: inositol monophosphatase [Bacteroidetes bacterium]|nr:inositol monophosphatase [Bacteroidota bacterium]
MVELAIDAAQEAGAYLRDNIGNIQHIERKGGEATNLVTEIDKQSEQIILRKIRQHYPDHDFLGEESGAHKISSPYRWIVDPLDGTVNYAHGVPIFAVSIAVEYNNELLLGVIYDPMRDELFTAERGKGAFLNGVRISVSRTSTLLESLLVTGFPYDVRKELDYHLRPFNEFLVKGQAIRRLGSAALDLAYVACGRFDGFWEGKLNPWDMAAGVLLVVEAGGRWTDYNGNSTTIYTPQMLATNGIIHDEMVNVLRTCFEDNHRS